MKKTTLNFFTLVLALSLSSFNSEVKQVSRISQLAGSHTIGELFGGGIIFSVTTGADGVQHGLVASLNNVSSGVEWSSNTRLLTGASSTSNGIVNVEAIKKAGGKSTEAAGLCETFMQGEFSDWYLPASDELKKLQEATVEINKALAALPGSEALGGFYWSSTEKMNGSAWGIDFGSGTATASNKMRNANVRAIRAF